MIVNGFEFVLGVCLGVSVVYTAFVVVVCLVSIVARIGVGLWIACVEKGWI